jgi:hypothetical protein
LFLSRIKWNSIAINNKKSPITPSSPDRSENPCCPGFGQQDYNGEQESYNQKCLIFLLSKNKFPTENKEKNQDIPLIII